MYTIRKELLFITIVFLFPSTNVSGIMDNFEVRKPIFISSEDFVIDNTKSNLNVQTQEYDEEKNCTNDINKRPNSLEYITHFNCGNIQIKNGQVYRNFTLIVEENVKKDIGENHTFYGWTYNGTIPGPTIRVTEGDIVSITMINNDSSKLPHSIHMHSIHEAKEDGVYMHNSGYKSGLISPGETYTYTFIASPAGVYPYHCHVEPIQDHINRGLYGALIIDPPIDKKREESNEMIMMMNSYDEDYQLEGPVIIESGANFNESGRIKSEKSADERENEIYTVNGKAFDYFYNPITIKANESQRIYLLNMVEFDQVNNFHLHGNMFYYYSSGTEGSAPIYTDIVTLSQADRGIIEFTIPYTGNYMMHSHIAEFSNLGWMGMFEVR